MPWLKVDDKMWRHPKTRRLLTLTSKKKKRDCAAMGLWVLAGSWAQDNGTGGWVPESELERFDDAWEDLVINLYSVGYWHPAKRNGEDGYQFNDWEDYNPKGPSDDGKFGNHVRWHVKMKVVHPDCEFCPKEPDELSGVVAPESPPNRPDSPRKQADSFTKKPPKKASGRIAPESSTNRVPIPIKDNFGDKSPQLSSATVVARDDVERVCEHLVKRLVETGMKKPPTVTDRWRKAARLMLDSDQIPEADIIRAIDWAMRSDFWQSNILSMPKLREKYETMRRQANRKPTSGGGTVNHHARGLVAAANDPAIEFLREQTGLRAIDGGAL